MKGRISVNTKDSGYTTGKTKRGSCLSEADGVSTGFVPEVSSTSICAIGSDASKGEAVISRTTPETYVSGTDSD